LPLFLRCYQSLRLLRKRASFLSAIIQKKLLGLGNTDL